MLELARGPKRNSTLPLQLPLLRQMTCLEDASEAKLAALVNIATLIPVESVPQPTVASGTPLPRVVWPRTCR